MLHIPECCAVYSGPVGADTFFKPLVPKTYFGTTTTTTKSGGRRILKKKKKKKEKKDSSEGVRIQLCPIKPNQKAHRFLLRMTLSGGPAHGLEDRTAGSPCRPENHVFLLWEPT